MKKRRFPWIWILATVILGAGLFLYVFEIRENLQTDGTGEGPKTASDMAESFFGQEPEAVRLLRAQEVPEKDQGHQEYYFQLLSEEEKRVYREMLQGIRERQEKFYLTSSEESLIDKVYHAVLKDHPELFWIHNRQAVYRTTYPGKDYSMFSPGVTYSDQEIEEIQAAMEQGYQDVLGLIPEAATDYEKVKSVYTYLIDHVDYVPTEHDQSLAGTFWKKQAVCAGYARGTQYLLERLGISCIYVEGDARDSAESHAWNLVKLNGEYYYVDATNGDQPEFLEGDAVNLVEHKTTMYDYLCPFPWEYEEIYTPSLEFPVPECTSSDLNFYVMNQGCFDFYDLQSLYDYCCMRLDNGAAVVRFKFSSQEAYNQAYKEWIREGYIESVAEYYMQLYGINSVEYHYGLLENMKTMYFMF